MRSEIDSGDAAVVTGMGEIMATHLAVFDCPGFISVCANFAPEISYSVYEALAQEDFKKAVKICYSKVESFDQFIGNLQSKYGPHTATQSLWGGDKGYMYIGAIKAAMDIVGIRYVGASIFDHTGKVIAGISIAAPALRIDKKKQSLYAQLITVTASHISNDLGKH